LITAKLIGGAPSSTTPVQKVVPRGIKPLDKGPRRVGEPLAGGGHRGHKNEQRHSAGTWPEPHTVIIARPDEPGELARSNGIRTRV
jgi:hypothetical protein